MKKPIKDWLKKLPANIAEKALSQVECKDFEAENLSDALLSFCSWQITKEGWEYWNAVHSMVARLEGQKPKTAKTAKISWTANGKTYSGELVDLNGEKIVKTDCGHSVPLGMLSGFSVERDFEKEPLTLPEIKSMVNKIDKKEGLNVKLCVYYDGSGHVMNRYGEKILSFANQQALEQYFQNQHLTI